MKKVTSQKDLPQHLALRSFLRSKNIFPFEKRKNPKLGAGFTIIELLIATTIFAMVLMVILASFMQVGRMFYKGVSVQNTSEATRSVADDISSEVRLAGLPTPNTMISASKGYFCIGTHRYTYVLRKKVVASTTVVNANNITAGMVKDITSDCRPVAAGSNPQQLLGPNMQLNRMNFSCPSGKGCTLGIHIVFYGFDNTVFDTAQAAFKNDSVNPARASGAPDAYCSGGLLSTQFCASADVSTNVVMRL
jgi:hypothetical protein